MKAGDKRVNLQKRTIFLNDNNCTCTFVSSKACVISAYLLFIDVETQGGQASPETETSIFITSTSAGI